MLETSYKFSDRSYGFLSPTLLYESFFRTHLSFLDREIQFVTFVCGSRLGYSQLYLHATRTQRTQQNDSLVSIRHVTPILLFRLLRAFYTLYTA